MIYAKQIPPKPVVGGGSAFVYVTVDTGQHINGLNPPTTGTLIMNRIRIIGEENKPYRILRFWSAALDYYSGENIIVPSSHAATQIFNGTSYVTTSTLQSGGGNIASPVGEEYVTFPQYKILSEPTYLAIYGRPYTGLVFMQFEYEYT